jgi:hypothetical protein
MKTMITDIKLPEKKKGRKSKEDREIYDSQLKAFADGLIKLSEEMEDKVSSRGWAYLMEDFRLINKSEFDYVQKLITVCRKNGMLPINFVAKDKNRTFEGVEDLKIDDYLTPKEFLIDYLEFLKDCEKQKDDISYWETQPCYIQMIVEKIDVLTVFKPLCEKYHIPIANGKGWPDVTMRNDLAKRFVQARDMGLKCILLYFGDFDPVGIKIGERYRKMIKDLELATGYDPVDLIIDPFGLSYEFIEENHLTWIDNIESGSGRKPDYKNPFIQEYIRKYGERKVEANIIIIPEVREKIKILFEETIQKYLGDDPLTEFEKQLREEKNRVTKLMNQLNFKDRIDTIISEIQDL